MDDDFDPGPSRDTRGHSRGRGKKRGGFSDQRSNSISHDRNRNKSVSWRAPRGGSSGSGRGRANLFMNENNLPLRAISGLRDLRELLVDDGLHKRSLSNNRRPNNDTTNNENYRSNHHDRGNGSENRNRGPPRRKFIGFKRLEEIAQSDSQDALAKITESKDAFMEILQSPIDKFDVFVLVIKCLEKVCQSSFSELKLKLMTDTFNSQFLVSLKSYLMELPYPQSKVANNMYWNDPDNFWRNLIYVFECVINTYPTLAMNKCRSLIEATSMACLEGLKERHNYNLPNDCYIKLKEFKDKLACYENNQKKSNSTSHQRFVGDEGAPPENFRELSLMPTKDDLLDTKPFLRPNIVDGAYQDVEHYLDVQFRLLREDCFGPLRQGLNQYLHDNKRKKFDHIRVFHNVKFARPYVSQTKIGSMVQIDLKTNWAFKRINWKTSKRFIFGGLVLFTKDNCASFLAATILDREEKYLNDGQIPVSLMGAFDEGLYNDIDTYTMIESEVYFEPYLHVLKALQDPAFPEHLAMKQYIVEVKPEPKHPSYLAPNTVYEFGGNKVIEIEENVETDLHSLNEDVDGNVDKEENIEKVENMDVDEQENEIIKYTVLQDETWPGKDMLHFNDSQLEAYKLALTHELAVVQGPPGTGKTYLGIKVAETLLRNLKNEFKGCILLIICYTNHALDQFLEALLKTTQSIVRVGGQSRNEAMTNINLTKLRSNINTHCDANQVFRDARSELKRLITKFQHASIELDVLTNGVLKCKRFEDVPEIELLSDFYKVSKDRDPLDLWLFDNASDYYYDDATLYEDDETADYAYVELEKENRKRVGVELDEENKNETELKEYRNEITVFSVVETDARVQHLISQYKQCPNPILKGDIRHEINLLNARKTIYNAMIQQQERRITHHRINVKTNFYYIAYEDRWALYFSWIERHIRQTKLDIGELQVRVNAASTAYDEARMLLDMQVLKNKRVVGMTTSGAARLRKLLQTLAPPIVIVEEAAEVLEQHIITSLTKDCKHLILIGDHQQLRPSAAHMKLARDYQLEVSLFERMISNGMHSRALSVQHRMRPEIAALICPHIYPELQNHSSVYDFPNVKGVTCNLFFLTHEHREQEVIENQSRTNHEEGELVLALANYLMQQGYYPEDVTILAAYKGQMFYMKKESNKYAHLQGVKITVVDNYQGEESKIILLSLVRNNADNKIGFLGTANRICVALSRAKEGFYIFGNIDNLKANSELWRNIAATLENGNSLGKSITLQCQNHPTSLTAMSTVKDFEETPEGGCKLLCEFTLARCGHRCLLCCHGYDREHLTYMTRCPRKCDKILCELNHVCPKKCAEDCGPCKVKVRKTLPCGHEADIHCYLEPDDPIIECYTIVDVTLPDCGHKTQSACYVKIKDIRCQVKCEYRIEKCGHSCVRNCHVNDDPDHNKYFCRKPCARAKAGCTAELVGHRGDHQCDKKCFEDCDPCIVKVVKSRSTCTHKEPTTCNGNVDEKPCMKKCNRKLPCNHFCKKKCSEVCGDCKDMVDKEIPDCKHKVKIPCQTVPTRELCTHKCQRKMSCGHKCKGQCSVACNPALCKEPSGKKVASPCGHDVTLPCYMAALPAESVEASALVSSCTEMCGALLACGHTCVSSCGACVAGRLHAACTQPCGRTNVCGHICEEPCNQVCPPCKKPCEVRCRHTRCRQQCGAPCTPCQEPCKRSCAHGRCSRRCGEKCSREPCSEPCPRRLRCGHPCRGLCAEPCPPVCKLCDPDNFPTDFLGDPFDDDTRFVLLQDCGHVLDVENMDNLMTSDTEAIEIRKCPFCRKLIINTGRYKDLVNKTFREGINPIKQRIYGNKNEIENKKKELIERVSQFREKILKLVTGLAANADIKTTYCNLHAVARSSKNVSKVQLDMAFICLDITDMIAECYQAYVTAKLTVLKQELDKQIKLMCSAFTFKLKAGIVLKVSEQQQKDLAVEIQRMHAIVQLAKILDRASHAKDKAGKEYEAATAAVFCASIFDEKRATDALEALQKATNLSGVLTKQERELIVKAMSDIKLGAWYRCPNGHLYCIADCGGAMEEGKCNECGASIGGNSHRLRTDNSNALEMDGALRPAWGANIQNNMANYRF